MSFRRFASRLTAIGGMVLLLTVGSLLSVPSALAHAASVGAAGSTPVITHRWPGNPAEPRASHTPGRFGDEGWSYTNNWSGYEAVNWSSYKEMSATWTVPTIASDGTLPAYVDQWIGFNGDFRQQPSSDNSPLVQIGVSAFMSTSKIATYNAWYEIVSPQGRDLVGSGGEVPLFNVKANEQITASISIEGNTIYFAINDPMEGKNPVFPWTDPSPFHQFTADWVVERPTLLINHKTTLAILADFNNTTFSGAVLKTTTNSWYPISHFSYTEDVMTRDGSRSGIWLAFPDTTTFTGSSFMVDYITGS